MAKMTPQEAIKFLTETIAGCHILRDKKLKAVCEASIEALEKQIPKKPYSDNDNGIYEKECCPNCHRSLFPNDHHCKCGQALDWSDAE